MDELGYRARSSRPVWSLLVLLLLLCTLVAFTTHLPASGTPIIPGGQPKLSDRYPLEPIEQQHEHVARRTGGRIVNHDSRDGPSASSGNIVTWSKEVPSTPGTEQQAPVVIHDAKAAILLTNGHQIKLYPLKDDDLIPSGGYYVIKSLEQFNLSDSKVIETLGARSSFTRWLKHKKQTHIEHKLDQVSSSSSPRDSAPSILPHESRRHFGRGGKLSSPMTDIVNEDDLFASDNSSGWKWPLISDVGHMFDSRFCPRALDTNCLVVFWVDKRNKLLRYGSHQFDPANRIELLSSKFDVHGNLRSLSESNKKTIWLHEFPPIDLCQQARDLSGHSMVGCEVASVLVDRDDRSIRVDLNLGVGGRPPRWNQFVGSLGHTDISVYYHLKSRRDRLDLKLASKINSPCLFFKIFDNHELYFLDMFNGKLGLVERMSSKPAIREPDEMQIYRGMLFFNDLATRTIMSTNTTRRKQSRQGAQVSDKARSSMEKKKLETIQKLESTHQVLVLEPTTIESFNIVSFEEDPQRYPCSNSETEASPEPRVIDDDLSENMTRSEINQTSWLNLAGPFWFILILFFCCIAPPYRVAFRIADWYYGRSHDKVAQYDGIQT